MINQPTSLRSKLWRSAVLRLVALAAEQPLRLIIEAVGEAVARTRSHFILPGSGILSVIVDDHFLRKSFASEDL